MFNKILFFLITNAFLIQYYYSQKILKVYEDWDDYIISIDGLFYKCPLCIPYKIRSNNGTISLSIPRIYDDDKIKNTTANVTFMSLRTEFKDDHYWVAWPFEEYVAAKEKHRYFPYRIFSVMGFDIDSSQNYYLLDQGIILQENNTIMLNTSKLLIFSNSGVLLNVFYFNNTEFTTSFLTDIVVEPSKKYAYITDSGILLNNQSIPRIIVIDLEKEKVYKILNNNSLFQPDENVEITYSENKIYNYFTDITGLNSIQISCDGKIIYFSSLKSKKIFQVYKKDILKAIEKYEQSNNEQDLNNINIIVRDKGIISQSFYISSKNNIYMTNGDKGSIQALYTLDEDILNYNFDDFWLYTAEKFLINWPSSIDIDNGKLYLLDNHYYDRNSNKSNYTNETNNFYYFCNEDIKNETENETVKTFVIYMANIGKDELSYKYGCSIYELKLNMYFISLSLWFLIIFLTAIFVMNIENKKKKKKKKNDEEESCETDDESEDENVQELNRRLNEHENDEDK